MVIKRLIISNIQSCSLVHFGLDGGGGRLMAPGSYL
jgi:hypothetical protein